MTKFEVNKVREIITEAEERGKTVDAQLNDIHGKPTVDILTIFAEYIQMLTIVDTLRKILDCFSTLEKEDDEENA